MRINVLFFALHREQAKTDKVSFNIDGDVDVKRLLGRIYEKYPQLKNLEENTIISLNHKITTPETALKDGDEVALFPPVSGG